MTCLFCAAVFVSVVAFATLLLRKLYVTFFRIPPLPKLDEKQWWGHGSPSEDDESIKPFEVHVPETVLNDLNQRLETARPFTPPLEGIQQQYGMNTKLLSEIVTFWKTQYNWREREQFLNKFPQFTTTIQGLNIHFVHVKPSGTSGQKVIPLLLLHGWPSTPRDFYEMIPLMVTPQSGRDFVFEVVVPSLPGYGFSQGSPKPGLGAAQIAVLFKNLMARLGFSKYYIQGGDWGAVITTHIGTLYPDRVLGIHVNMTAVSTPMANLKLLAGSIFPRLVVDKKNEGRVYPLSNIFNFMFLELGYMHIQATKPDTVGVGLNDSPVGLAAYILEKFITWTNQLWNEREDGGLTLKFSYTDLLDDVMIFWVTNSITTSMRLYAETFNKAQTKLKLDRIPVKVPSAVARFGTDVGYQPETILKEKYAQLLQASDLPTGGHFAPFEEPQLLADDVWSAVEKFEAYHKKLN